MPKMQHTTDTVEGKRSDNSSRKWDASRMARLEEAEEALRAIRAGEADAIVVQGATGEQIYTLRGADHSYRVFMQQMSEGAATLSKAGICTYCNPRLAEFFGKPLDQVVGTAVERYVVVGERERFRTLVSEAKEGSSERRTGEFAIQQDNGNTLDVLVSVSTARMDDDQATCLVATDITQRKRSEQSLKLYQAFLNKAEEIGQSGSFDWCLTTNVMRWSRGMYSIFRIAPVDFDCDLAVPLELMAPDDRQWLEEIRERVSKTGEAPRHVERTILSASATERRITMQGEVFRDESGYPVRMIGLVRDVTERRQLEEHLLQSEKMEAIGRLAGGVAHDFNNMLAPVIGYADMLARTLADSEQRRFAEGIVRSARRASELVARLLGFARGGKYVVSPVDIHKTISEVAELLEHSIDRQVAIEQTLRSGPLMVIGDPSQLTNVLMNLALNARDAMPNGGRLVFSTEIVECSAARCKQLSPEMAAGTYGAISVSDTGVGMDQATMKRVFEPFFTTKLKDKGHGMGLASAYGTVRNHGGAITVSSQPGRGSTFTVFLPLSPSKQDVPQVLNTSTRERGSARVLVVDDEECVCAVTKDMLSSLGYTVTTCVSGNEALDLYQRLQTAFDIVILDMVMPGLSGRETLLGLRNINGSVKVLLSSGYSIEEQAQEMLANGAIGFVQKPYDAGQLSRRIRDALDSSGRAGRQCRG